METTNVEVLHDGIRSCEKARVYGRFTFYGEEWVITPSTLRYHPHHLMDVKACSLFSVTHAKRGLQISPATDSGSVDEARKAAKRFLKARGRVALKVAIKQPGLII